MPFKPLYCSPLLSHPKEGDSHRIIVIMELWVFTGTTSVSLTFGFKHESAQMQRLGDLVCHQMTKQNFAVYPYIDDIIGIQDNAQADVAFQIL